MERRARLQIFKILKKKQKVKTQDVFFPPSEDGEEAYLG